jgi:hypothetical protein
MKAIALTPLGSDFGFDRPVTQSNGGLLVRSYRPPQKALGNSMAPHQESAPHTQTIGRLHTQTQSQANDRISKRPSDSMGR